MNTESNATNPTETPARTRHPLDPVFRVLKALASLQLTVVLFALSIALVFFGTVAQMEYGIWTVVDKYFWSWHVMVPVELFHKFAQVFLTEYFPKDTPPWTGAFPFPAGKLLGGLMLLNLLAAHAVRLKVTWKRTGVLLIHSGLILLFVGEFITREFAVEQQMTIAEGQKVNFAEETRAVELAFVDKSDPAEDRVTVVPQSTLRAGGKVTHPDLPADIEVTEYMVNSVIDMVGRSKRTANPATAGVGLAAVATGVPEVSGVDPQQKIDVPSAYIKLTGKGGEAIGTYLASLNLYRRGMLDDIDIGGKKYEVALRFKRHYKPFSIYLVDFRFDRFPGTNKPKNYSSEIKLYDADGQLAREQTIRMNEPLRFQGETFYQSSFENEGEAVESTVLQVVKNPGWLIPYISCVMVGLGLLVHFGLMLGRFLTKHAVVAPQTPAEGSPEAVVQLPWVQRNAHWIALGVVALYLLSVYGRMKPRGGEYDLDSLAKVPVLDGGRVKPLDSVARVYLRSISGKSVFDDENKKEQPAIRWFLDTLAATPKESEPAWNYRVIRIDNEQVLAELKLEVREGLRYSMNELRKHLKTLIEKHQQATAKRQQKKPLDTTDSKFLELYDRVSLLQYIARGRGHDNDANKLHLLPPAADGAKWESLGQYREDTEKAAYGGAVLAARAKLDARPGGFTQTDQLALLGKLVNGDPRKMNPKIVEQFLNVYFYSDPATHTPEMRDELLGLLLEDLPPADRAAIEAKREGDAAARTAASPAAAAWEAILAAYRAKKPVEFNTAVAEYLRDRVAHVSPGEMKGTRLELSYNRFSPFLHCVGLYVFALVLCLIGFVLRAAELPGWGESLRRSAVVVLLATLVLHTASLVVRMSLMDRPLVFVTNLYSSAVFIGWGCVGIGLVLERLYPIGIGNVLAAVLGVSTTIVAHNLATDDTLEMMQAVLDTNFWLATHVTTVTLGYTATFVAGFIGAMYVFLMLAAVVRESFENPKAEAGHLLAFGTAAAGLVAIPLMIAWPVVNALAQFEVVHSSIPNLLFYGVGVAGLAYAFALFVHRAPLDGTGPKGPTGRGAIPGLARPVAAMALTPVVSRILGQMAYGVLAFAMMLSFIGTVLGGIWADQSWGRFWGWDPKENGAVLIVLWNALILHARWCGLVKNRGVAVLAVFGNVVTAWSWFGTNQLGIGLHAYGFDTRLADGCTNFWMTQLMIIGLGLISSRFWQGSAPPAAKLAGAEVAAAAQVSALAAKASANGHMNGAAGKGKKSGKKR